MKDKILESVKYVVDNSVNVKINNEAVNSFTDNFIIGETTHWLHYAPFDIFKLPLNQQVNLILIMSAVSFSYWGMPKWTVDYKGTSYDGAYGMFCALGRAIENGYPILDSRYLSQISKEDFEQILKGNVQIPLFEERLKIIREIGRVLNNTFDKDFFNAMKQVHSGTNLFNIIIDNFAFFTDKSIYKNREVFFYKKAQLLTADILQLIPDFQGKDNMFSGLTGCADYKLPQVLREFGLLEYNNSLADRVDRKVEIEKDSEEENEIRANTIWALELVRERLKNRLGNIPSMVINDQVWLMSQNNSKMKPYHLTRTTAY